MIRWDKLNKWLCFGTKKNPDIFTILFDNYCWDAKQPIIRQWTLFQVMWDNGAWWGDLEETEEISVPYMKDKYIEHNQFTIKSGSLPCFFQITIAGVGFRYWYEKKMSVIFPK